MFGLLFYLLKAGRPTIPHRQVHSVNVMMMRRSVRRPPLLLLCHSNQHIPVCFISLPSPVSSNQNQTIHHTICYGLYVAHVAVLKTLHCDWVSYPNRCGTDWLTSSAGKHFNWLLVVRLVSFPRRLCVIKSATQRQTRVQMFPPRT